MSFNINFMIFTHTPPGTDCSLDYWTTTYHLPSEELLKKDNLLTTIPKLAKGWKVSFELKPPNYNYRSYASVIHMTSGGSKSSRTPALMLHRTRGVYLATALNGSSSVGRLFQGKNPPVNEWTLVEISQVKVGFQYVFSVVIRGELLWSVTNTQPRELDDVKVFASNPWRVAQAGFIRELRIDNLKSGKIDVD